VLMGEVSGRFRALERDAAAYEDLLAGFTGFTLQRWLLGPTCTADVYESHDAAEVAELRRLLAALGPEDAEQ
jgi:hypothetical protein